jgi:hypothetical protein
MAFDFNSVIQEAQNAIKNSGGGEGYKYQLVYPNVGNLTVKLLFNPKSNLVKRAINRHTIGEDKIACMKTYGQDCPICKVLEDAQNARGIDLGKMRSVVRGISLAQYVESDYKIDKVKPGDIILLMYPWTVYKDISTILSQAKTEQEIASLIASNEGFLFTITRGTDNKYSTQVNPFKKYKSANSDDEFMAMLNSLDDLNTMVLSNPISEEALKDVREVAQELTNTYLVSRTPQYQRPAGEQMPMSFGSFAQPQQPAYNPAPTQQQNYQSQAPAQQPAPPAAQPAADTDFVTLFDDALRPLPFQQPQQQPAFQQSQYQAPSNPGMQPSPQTSDPNKPPCFGRHGQEDMNKCLLCPSEIACAQGVKGK